MIYTIAICLLLVPAIGCLRSKEFEGVFGNPGYQKSSDFYYQHLTNSLSSVNLNCTSASTGYCPPNEFEKVITRQSDMLTCQITLTYETIPNENRILLAQAQQNPL
jgi:hypothetical protein